MAACERPVAIEEAKKVATPIHSSGLRFASSVTEAAIREGADE